MAEQKNIRKKDYKEFNPEKYKREQERRRRELQRRNAYEPIEQEEGEPLPPLAVQWKEDAKRRWGKNENSRNR
jgi:hypothetical protein